MTKEYCIHCKKNVKATTKMWHTVVCNECNRIISGDNYIGKKDKSND